MSYKRALGAEFVSPALQRGEMGLHESDTESRRDGARTLLCGIRQPLRLDCKTTPHRK
jgi:hypothetical protein